MTERPIGVTDVASGAGVADYRVRERVVGANTVDEQYLIQISERVKSGVYAVNTGRHFLTAAAQAATAGYWFFVNPIGSTVLVALRHSLLVTGLTTGGITLATSPRLNYELFTYTGTPSGATITPAKLKSSYPAATAVLYTANTGMTITNGALIKSSLPWFAFTGTTACVQCTNIFPSYVRDYPAGQQFPTWGDAGTVVLGAGEGILFRQADAGSTSEATHRVVITDLLWEEYTLP